MSCLDKRYIKIGGIMSKLGKYLIASGSVTTDPSKLHFLDKMIIKIKKLFKKKQL